MHSVQDGLAGALEAFTYAGHQVRTVIVDGEPWFVAVDVTNVLGFTNGRMAVNRLDDDGVSRADVIDAMGRKQTATILNEPGLYELIMRSDKPEAKAFRRWVTHEVLPQIRATGRFGQSQIEHQAPQTYADALRELASVVERQEQLEAQAAIDAPKVAAYDALMDAEGFFTMEAAAKIGGIGRTRLFSALRSAGVIQWGSRIPYQRYMHWFKMTPSTWTDAEGVVHASHTPRVRPDALDKVLAKAGIDLEAVAA